MRARLEQAPSSANDGALASAVVSVISDISDDIASVSTSDPARNPLPEHPSTRDPQPEILNPPSSTLSPKPQIPNPQLRSLIPTPQTPNPKPDTPIPTPQSLIPNQQPQSRTQVRAALRDKRGGVRGSPQPSTLNPKP